MGSLHLESIVADPDGSKLLRDSRDGDDPTKLGNDAGAALLSRGGDEEDSRGCIRAWAGCASAALSRRNFKSSNHKDTNVNEGCFFS